MDHDEAFCLATEIHEDFPSLRVGIVADEYSVWIYDSRGLRHFFSCIDEWEAWKQRELKASKEESI